LGDVGERRRRVGEEHRPEPAHRDIERGFVEEMDLGVGVEERHVGQLRFLGACPGDGEHGLGQVDADHLAVGSDRACCGECRGAAAAADVEHPLGTRAGRVAPRPAAQLGRGTCRRPTLDTSISDR
jgi:hypothetical protein